MAGMSSGRSTDIGIVRGQGMIRVVSTYFLSLGLSGSRNKPQPTCVLGSKPAGLMLHTTPDGILHSAVRAAP